MIFHPLSSHPASRTFPSPITNGGGAPDDSNGGGAPDDSNGGGAQLDDSDGGPGEIGRGGVMRISACGLGIFFAAMEGLDTDMVSACGAIYEKLGLNRGYEPTQLEYDFTHHPTRATHLHRLGDTSPRPAGRPYSCKPVAGLTQRSKKCGR